MERRTPTHNLPAFKKAFSRIERLAMTLAARQDAVRLGFTDADVVDAIQHMKAGHFFKSMTSYHCDTEWQDVYHVPFRRMVIYVKFRADRVTEFRLLSFKEK